MKKILIVAILAVAVVFTATAQPRAVGARTVLYDGAMYQHTVGGLNAEDFVEVNLGWFYGAYNIGATASYNFMIAQPSWTDRGEWGFYAGPGLALGTSTFHEAAFSVMGQVGLEYTFWFPLRISVDLRPQFGLVGGSAKVFNRDELGDLGQDVLDDFGINANGRTSFCNYNVGGLFGFIPSITVAYRF